MVESIFTKQFHRESLRTALLHHISGFLFTCQRVNIGKIAVSRAVSHIADLQPRQGINRSVTTVEIRSFQVDDILRIIILHSDSHFILSAIIGFLDASLQNVSLVQESGNIRTDIAWVEIDESIQGIIPAILDWSVKRQIASQQAKRIGSKAYISLQLVAAGLRIRSHGSTDFAILNGGLKKRKTAHLAEAAIRTPSLRRLLRL